MPFEVADMIREYSLPFELVTRSEGSFDQENAGRWTPGEDVKTMEQGALIPLPTKIIYDSGGALTTKDRHLFITKPVPIGSECHFKNDIYVVQGETDWGDYADAYKYILKNSSQKKK